MVPLGKITLTGPGTTVNLAVNCGAQAGQVQNQGTPLVIALPGKPFRQLILTNAGAGAVFIMPRGFQAALRPDLIMGYIPSGATQPFPWGQPFENAVLPENFDLDCSAACTVYGCGIING
jgi:hypothetical protein